MEDFLVTCPLVPDVPHLISGSCSSPRTFGLGFLQTLPHDNALALLLTFGSTNTWYEDFHLASPVPCPAHTLRISGQHHAADGLQETLRNTPSVVLVRLHALVRRL